MTTWQMLKGTEPVKIAVHNNRNLGDRLTTPEILPKVIKDRNIENLTFDKAKGGTLTLGGNDNRAGVLNLKDGDGNVILTLDKSGITITDTNDNDLLAVTSDGDVYISGGREAVNTGRIYFDGLGGNKNNYLQYAVASGMALVSEDSDVTISASAFAGGQVVLLANKTGSVDIAGGSLGARVFNGGTLAANSDYVSIGHNGTNSFVSSNSGELKLTAPSTKDITLETTGSGGHVRIKDSTGNAFFLHDGSSTYNQITIDDNAGTTRIIRAGSTAKTAIMKMDDGSHKALYCVESPEVWFMDFVSTNDINQLDKDFLEVTTTPYHFIPTTSGMFQVWGKRYDMTEKRFENMTEYQYESNNKFWRQAHQ